MTRSLPADSDSFLPTATLDMLQLRAKLLAAVRRFFDGEGYWEAETPILSHDLVVDAYLEPFVTHWSADAAQAPGRREEPLYLQTSPEFGMKRLLAAGAQTIYQIARVMRNAERGRNHNPEFTMVEWYRVRDTHHDQMIVVERLVTEVFRTAAQNRPSPSATAALDVPFQRLSYDEAFERFAGTRVLHRSCAELERLARDRGLVPPPGLAHDDRDGWLNFLLAELVEPRLGRSGAVFLYDYPASQAALARVRPDDPPVAERFELYLHGVELCNGYHELTDPDELRARMRQQAALRERNGCRPLPMENRLLAAMQAGLPPCAGVALGFDRLMMLAVGAASIDEVIAFPLERA